MKAILHIYIFFCIHLLAQESTKVLFIGNSYTFYNKMPQMVKKIAESTGEQLQIQQATNGGYSFKRHATKAATLALIKKEKWDYVVLQGYSLECAQPLSVMEEKTIPYLDILIDSIRNNHHCTQIIFYNTWGRKEGVPALCEENPILCSYTTMDSTIRANYQYLAQRYRTKIAPVGLLWTQILSELDWELYNPDKTHPSYLGSFIAAHVFYTIITEKDPLQSPFSGKINDSISQQVKEITKRYVFKDLDHFAFNQNTTDFKVEINNKLILCSPDDEQLKNIQWNYGDQHESKEPFGLHKYKKKGEYQVILEAEKCNMILRAVQNITIN